MKRSFSLFSIRQARSLCLLGATLASPSVGWGLPEVLDARQGSRVSWPTVVGRTYQAQWAPSPTGPWNDLGNAVMGSGAAFSLDDFAPGGGVSYRILETTPGTTAGLSIVRNGGLEDGSGASAENWTLGASQPPVRSDLEARTGSFSLRARPRAWRPTRSPAPARPSSPGRSTTSLSMANRCSSAPATSSSMNSSG